MDELIASADNTAPITITTAIHSVWDKPKKKPAITTQIAAKQCIHALCSFCINKRMPLKAYRKLASRLRKVKPLFFILFIVLRERDKDTNNTSKTDTMFIFGHCCLEHVADNQLYIFWHSFCQWWGKTFITMKKIYIAIISLLLSDVGLQAQEQDTVRLTLKEAINLAQMQSVDAAVALNELKTAYWEYRTHVADQLPEINFKGTLPAYSKQYTKYQQSDGSYTFVQNNSLGLNGEISIDQNIALTGGKISLNSSLDFNRQLGKGAFNEYMSVPIGLTLTQPIFGVNDQKWKRRIEPVRYQEAKAAYIESVEGVTINTIGYFSICCWRMRTCILPGRTLKMPINCTR